MESKIENEEELTSELYLSIYNNEIETFQTLFNSLNLQNSIKRNKKGNNYFHISCALNSFKIVEFILKMTNNLLINERNKWNETSLHISVAGNNYLIVELLLKYGADYKLKDCWGRTPKTVRKCYYLFIYYLF